MGKRLFRSRENKVLAGVCGGIAEYFAVDPTIVRILFIILALSGPGIIAYIIAVFVIPERPADYFYGGFDKTGPAASQEDPFKTDMGDWKEPAKYDTGKNGILIGAILIILGGVFFIRQFFSWFDMKYLFPVILVGLGFVIIFRGRRGSY